MLTVVTQLDSQRTSLQLYGDVSRLTLIRSVTSATTAPFVVHSDTFAYTFSDRGQREVGVKSWGYRIIVSPIWRLQVGSGASEDCM